MAILLQIRPTLALAAALLPSACMRGPGFMKQQGAVDVRQSFGQVDPTGQDLPIEIVATTVQGEAATGTLNPESAALQIVQAAETSSIAGAAAEFPPGTIAVATEITIEPGASIAESSAVTDLSLGNLIAATAPSVMVTSATIQDTAQPFTVALPLPAETALRLQADQNFDKLVVLYRVQSAADNIEKIGYVTRASLVIKDNFVRFQTRHFGTFQAIYTREVLVDNSKEVAGPLITPKLSRKVWYVAGPTGVVFANESERGAGVQAWFLGFMPATVSNFERVLQTGAIAQTSKEP